MATPIIDQIRSYPFGRTQLFFDEARLGDEVRLNLASFPGSNAGLSDEAVRQVADALQDAIARMEMAVGDAFKTGKAIFYMWHDDYSKSLRWTIISDVGQSKLPFSSNVNFVDVETVVNEWAKPADNTGLLTILDIEKMTPGELSKINRGRGIPTINVFVRRVLG